MNKSFFSANEIYLSLAGVHRKKIAEYDKVTIVRWCVEVITDFIGDPGGRLERTAILGTPKNKMLHIPAIVIARLKRVYDVNTNKNVEYSHQGDYLVFSDNYLDKSIGIEYDSFALDDDGFPMIPRGYEAACKAYCVYNMYKEDFLSGLIDGNRWRAIESDKDWEIEAAARAWDEINENAVDSINSINVNNAYKSIVK